MTIYYYLHAPVEYIHERRALLRAAQCLQRQPPAEDLVLVANLEPDMVPAWQEQGLTQLDALLLAPDFVAILDFKNCADPFDGRNLDRSWPILTEQGQPTQYRVAGGSSKNPVKQVGNAKYRWGMFLQEAVKPVLARSWLGQRSLNWSHLNAWVLFHPYLHPEARLPNLAERQKWLVLAGVDKIADLVFGTTSQVQLSLEERLRVAEEVLHARPWAELHDQLEAAEIAYLHVPQSGGGELAHPIHRADSLLLGRSRENEIVISTTFSRVSRRHARLEVQEQAVRLYDLHSTHGTYVQSDELRQVDSDVGMLLHDGEFIYLGHPEGHGSCRLTFSRQGGGARDEPTAVTLQD